MVAARRHFLVAAIVVVPLLGIQAVATTLADIFRDSAGVESGMAVLLTATITTLVLSTSTGIPTSITLALVGAAAGGQIANGSLDVSPVLRVLALAAAGPVAASAIALLLTRLLTLGRGRHIERVLQWQHFVGFAATAVAYAANDGQKLLAVLAVTLAASVNGSAMNPFVIGIIIMCFTLGAGLGLRRSTQSLRRGVLHPKPYQVVATLWSSATAVLIGAGLAAPMSMTQSITGALIGSAPPRGWRRLRWEQTRRILLAWLWTLPIAGLASWALTVVMGLTVNR